jgi:hypothetical protein
MGPSLAEKGPANWSGAVKKEHVRPKKGTKRFVNPPRLTYVCGLLVTRPRVIGELNSPLDCGLSAFFEIP